MKNYIAILVFIFCLSTSGYSQANKIVEETKSDKFSNRSGSLIEKDFIEFGKVASTDITVLKMKDLNSGESISAVRFRNTSYSSSLGEDEYLNSIDKEELDGLIISVKKLINEVLNSEPERYTEVIYRSVSGLQFGAYYNTDVKNKGWKPFIQVDRFRSKSMKIIKEENLNDFLTILEKAKTIL